MISLSILRVFVGETDRFVDVYCLYRSVAPGNYFLSHVLALLFFFLIYRYSVLIIIFMILFTCFCLFVYLLSFFFIFVLFVGKKHGTTP